MVFFEFYRNVLIVQGNIPERMIYQSISVDDALITRLLIVLRLYFIQHSYYYNSHLFYITFLQVKHFKCLLCEQDFDTRKLINEHYHIDHRIVFQYAQLQFQNIKEFERWKIDLEHKSYFQFSIAVWWKPKNVLSQNMYVIVQVKNV